MAVGRIHVIAAALAILYGHLIGYAAPPTKPNTASTPTHWSPATRIGAQGGVPTRRNFNRVWKRALADAGIPADMDLHLHDLRHTGSTWSAQSGATLKELMARIGHSSTRAAMVYQHASRDRDHAIAAALDALIGEARTKVAG